MNISNQEETPETWHVLSHGRVQGVWYRDTCMRYAQEHNITGWVRNRRGGSVEAMIAGDAGQIQEMLAWSREGPTGASVDKVVVETGYGEYADFEYRPTV